MLKPHVLTIYEPELSLKWPKSVLFHVRQRMNRIELLYATTLLLTFSGVSSSTCTRAAAFGNQEHQLNAIEKLNDVKKFMLQRYFIRVDALEFRVDSSKYD